MKGKDVNYKTVMSVQVRDKNLKEGLTLGLDRKILISYVVGFDAIGCRG